MTKSFSFAIGKTAMLGFQKTNKSAFAAAFMALGLAACGPMDETEKRAQSILAQMTLEEKIGQVIQGDISTVTPEDAKHYNLGSVLNGGN